MTGPLRAGIAVVALLVLGCQSASDRHPRAGAGGLTEGPTRWLMLPEELRQASRLNTSRDAVEFIEAFWRHRDPDPAKPGNEFERIFDQRVEAADRLYGEDGMRGSLTDRGRALILLGPPPILRYSQKPAPSWEPGKPGARPSVHSRQLALEIWAYPVKDLPPAFVQLLGEGNDEVTLTFEVEAHGTRLIDGEKYLVMAARAAVRP